MILLLIILIAQSILAGSSFRSARRRRYSLSGFSPRSIISFPYYLGLRRTKPPEVKRIVDLAPKSRGPIKDFVSNIHIAVRYSLPAILYKYLKNHADFVAVAGEWLDIPLRKRMDMFNLNLFNDGPGRSVLAYLLTNEIQSYPTSREKCLLLDVYSMILQSQDWNRLPFHFLYDLLEHRADVIADYLPEAAWKSLTLQQAEMLLDLDIDVVTRHVKEYKSNFIEDVDHLELRKLDNLPWSSFEAFTFTGEAIQKELDYNGFFKFKIGLKPAPSGYNFFIHFNPESELIPEFTVSIESSGGSSILAQKIVFANEGYRDNVLNLMSRRVRTIRYTVPNFISYSLLTPESKYVLVFRLMRLRLVHDISFENGLEVGTDNPVNFYELHKESHLKYQYLNQDDSSQSFWEEIY